MTDLLNLWRRQVMVDMNCHGIATIESFDPVERKVTAKMQYGKTYYYADNNGKMQAKQIEYPLLLDIPLVILCGGGARLTFPIAPGDECLILFNDRDLNNWWAGATSGPVASTRLHSFSDGMALVGFDFSDFEYDNTRAALSYGTTRVAVGEEKVLIENQTATLNDLLQQLITVIKGITTTNAVPGNPCAISPASQLLLDNVATALGELLE